MKNLFSNYIFRILLTIAIFVCFSGNYLVGATDVKSPTNSQKGLTVSPLRSEFDIAPGTSYDGNLVVTNSTDKPMNVNLNAETFNVANQQYDYVFNSESNVSKWVNFETMGVSLQPNESKNVKYSIGVPLSAEPGGRYISLFATNDIESANGNISSRQRIASLLYITVTGDVTRLGHVLSLNSPWMVSGKSNWSVVLQNIGSTHFRSIYSVKIKSLISDTTVANMSGNALILPNTVRLVDNELPLPIFPGLYKAVYMIGLGDTPSKTEVRLIVYVPSWLMLVFGLFIFIVSLNLVIKKYYRVKKPDQDKHN